MWSSPPQSGGGEAPGGGGGANGPFDLIVDPPAGTDAGPWEEAGATWVLADFGRQPREAEVREAIEAGPA